MGKKVVIAEVIDSNNCQHYAKGTKFVICSAKPEGMCEAGYHELARQAKAFLYNNGPILGEDEKFLVRCPHPNSAFWEIRLEEPAKILK
jgi:hypothetical protein